MTKWLFSILFICCITAGCQKTTSDLEKVRAQGVIDDKIVADYILAHNLTGVAKKVTDTSGVYYIVVQPGQGNDLFTSSTQVTVGDTGKELTTGRIFTETNDFHPSYPLSEVMLGWRLGIPKIKRGGIVRLLIPSRYAYSIYPQEQYGLKANTILDFDIQLYDITN
ncbi:MAG: peptidylprolyl isomerase [Mucilaginibacter sp.]|nr:peptidylprolyl isomerase [Mucilaginibacter sp.]